MAGLRRKEAMAFRLEVSRAPTTRVRSAPTPVPRAVPRAMDGMAEAWYSSSLGSSSRWVASLSSGSAVAVAQELEAAAPAVALSHTGRRLVARVVA